MNAVLIALDKELVRFKNSAANGVPDKGISAYINRLCVLWNSYEGRIKEEVFAEKILELGDFLCSLNYHMLSSGYCYGRLLYSKFGFALDVTTDVDEQSLLSSFFPDENNSLEVVNTIRALIGYSSSASFALLRQDEKFQNADTPHNVANLLRLMQLAMQVGLKKDRYCWLVYNGTLHIYTICRIFMSNGFSRHILKYLIWACVCMESSVPLLTVKYFNWRSQLYTITCQCYYDLKADAEAEKFAQRGLQKVEELREIESISSSVATPESTFMFSLAVIRLNLMVFKRQVYENKRRAKGALRSKIKPLLKDILHSQWPRTSTERLLAETFRSRSSQFLAVVEALSNSNRRLIQTGLGVPENDDCFDAYLELFFAGVELLAGGGGAKPPVPGKHDNPIVDTINNIPLVNLAASESQSISLASAVRFLKLSYNYESWETFDLLIQPISEELLKYPEDELCIIELKLLNLLSAMYVINPSRIRKKMAAWKGEDTESGQGSQKNKSEHIENVLKAATMMNDYVLCDNSKAFIAKHQDTLVDIVIILWNKCRKYFMRITASTFDVQKYQDKLFLKWLKILTITQKLIITLNLNDIDICVCTEASLKLAVILECVAANCMTTGDSSELLGCKKDVSLFHFDHSYKSRSPDEEILEPPMVGYLKDICTFLEINDKPIHLLEFVREMLKSALNSIISGRDNLLKPYGGIADDSFMSPSSSSNIGDMYTLNMEAYHLEVTYQYYHIICLINAVRLSENETTQVKKKGLQQKRPLQKSSDDPINKEFGISMTGKNDLLKALYLLSLVEVDDKLKSRENTQRLEESYTHIQKAIQMESKIRNDNTTKEEANTSVPPAPLLVQRGCSCMVLEPAPFKPKGGEKIRWYCLYLRNAAGNNVKVRLNDTKYKGTGEEVPYTSDCTFTVRGLEPNERYVAAVAAYDKSGHLIGGSIGDSGRPFIATHILPCLLAYGKLCRVAYNKNSWKLSKLSYNMLWQHFVDVGVEETSNIKSVNKVHNLHPYKLKLANVENSSVVMLQHVIESIFISVDIAVKERSLFCDSLCDQGSLTSGQMSRLNECEKLLIAVEVSGWLNDNMLCLQAVVLTYSLLAPIIHWKLPIIAVLKVLLHIHSLLQEIQTIFKNKKQNSTTDCLRHMVSCLAYYTAKILVYFDKKHEAIEVLECCCKLVAQINAPENFKSKVHASIPDDDTASTLSGKKNKKKVRVKTKGGTLKSLSETQPGVLLEIRALEMYTLKLQREVATECNNELTGNEDVIVMNAVVSSLPVPLAYKEVVKFKRRAQFFEAFVGILSRALNDGSYENVLEWVKETVGWLTKRNEIILNKVLPDTKGLLVVASNIDVDKLKRYSTAVVEYGRSGRSSAVSVKDGGDLRKSELPSNNSNKVSNPGSSKHVALDMNASGKYLMPIISEERSEAGYSSATQKGFVTSKGHKNPDDKKMSEEKRAKDAGMKLHILLSDSWKIMQRRRKMRNVCFEELPWRCQMNLISAECHFQICLTSFENIAKQHGCGDLKKDNSIMDINWFTLSTSGALIVSWAGCMKTCEKSIEKTVDIGGVTLDHKAEVHIVPSASKQTLSVKVDKKPSWVKQPSFHRTEGHHRKEDMLRHFLKHLEQTYLQYQRSIVLSHRGQNWVLLQQTCNKLLNTTQTLIVNIMLLNTNIDTTVYEIPYKLSQLRTSVYKSFSMAAEFLIDCMNDIKNQWIPGSGAHSYGDIRTNKGGCSLSFDYLDCNSYIDYGNIKRVITFAVEVLFYEQKWEKLTGIIMKFNAISHDHFSESLLPILVVSQRYLSERMSVDDSAIDMHPSIIFDENTGVPLDVSLACAPPEPIEVGAHIDPIGHNLYNIPLDGSKYSIVPITYETTNAKLKHLSEGRAPVARMLEHSRKLCLSYLAGKQGNKHIEQKMQRVASAVSFLATQVKPPLIIPIDYKAETLEIIEDIETHPVSSNFLSIVISSYEDSIQLLSKHQHLDLAAQAMHELGNIMFYRSDTKAAYKWWACALDTILNVSNSLDVWRTLMIDLENNSLNCFKPFIDNCGIWGCMLGGMLATKIARYIHFSHVDMCRNACHLAAAFFKALFCTSLVHPSSYHSYASYDIGINKPITKIIPGLNLFSDDNRIHCSNLTDCTIWLSEHLIKFGFYLEVQPLLTFSQYLASTICKDVSSAVEVKLLRIESLCRLHMFSSAVEYFSQIIMGCDISSVSESMKLKLKPKLKKFDDSLPVYNEYNVGIINELCKIVLKDTHYNVYGVYLSNKILYMQANILVYMAKLIYEVPIFDESSQLFADVEKPVAEEELLKVNKKTSHHRKKSYDEKEEAIKGSNKISPNNQQEQHQRQKSAPTAADENKMDSVNEDGLECPSKLKGRLLQYAHNIIQQLSPKSLSTTTWKDELVRQDLEMYLRYRIMLSQIEYEKLLVVSAACHIFTCLQAISEANIPNNADVQVDEECDISVRNPNVPHQIKSPGCTDIYTWLFCKELLCFYLQQVESTMGMVASSVHSTIAQVGSVEDNIDDAINECDMFNDKVTQYIFTFMRIEIDVKKGKNTMEVLENLKKLEDKVNLLPEKSYHTRCVLFDLKKLVADLKSLKEADTKESIGYYENVELAILDELCFLGYTVNMETKYPIFERMNVNIPVLEGLMCSKVSRYRSTALMTAMIQNKSTNDDWRRILAEVKMLLNFMDKVTMKLPLMEIEILLLQGEIQRYLVRSDLCTIYECVKTFLRVIHLSSTCTCDFATIRQCYLEIAMAVLSKPNTKMEEELKKVHHLGNTLTSEISFKKRKSQGNVKQHQQGHTQRKLQVGEKAAVKEAHRIGKGVWICIRAASILAQIQQKLELLASEVAASSDLITGESKNSLPQFALEDILGMTTAEQKIFDEQTCDRSDGKVNNTAMEITSAKLLNYATHLRRTCSYSSHLIGENKVSVVRIPQKCHMSALKLKVICTYLENNSTVYQQNCLTALPIDVVSAIVRPLQPTTRSEAAIATNENNVSDKLSGSFSAPGNIPSIVGDNAIEPRYSSGSHSSRVGSSKSNIRTEKVDQKSTNLLDAEKAKEFEIAVQWYVPELENRVSEKIHLLVAVNNKNIAAKTTSAQHAQASFVRHFIVDKKEVIALHESIVKVLEIEEAAVALQGQQGYPMSLSPTGSPTRSPSTSSKGKTISPTKIYTSSKVNVTKSNIRIEKEDELKKKLSSLALSLNHMLVEQDPTSHECAVEVEITFDANLNTIGLLANWLNPSFGHIARTSDTFFYWMVNVFGVPADM